jgi:hypothetical protein
MSVTEVVLEGTLKPDGTLELDEQPKLAPGRVKVVLRHESEPTPPKEDWFQHLQRIRAEREAAGYPFMNEEETNAYVEWLRESVQPHTSPQRSLAGVIDEIHLGQQARGFYGRTAEEIDAGLRE